jgi:plasmid stabilization system protein ParE
VTTYRISFTPEALRQLVALDEYLAAAGVPDSQFAFSIVDYCDSLATFPHRGRLRADLYPGLRITGYQKRVAIAYTVEIDSVIVLGVFYGGQDYDAHFQSE